MRPLAREAAAFPRIPEPSDIREVERASKSLSRSCEYLGRQIFVTHGAWRRSERSDIRGAWLAARDMPCCFGALRGLIFEHSAIVSRLKRCGEHLVHYDPPYEQAVRDSRTALLRRHLHFVAQSWAAHH